MMLAFWVACHVLGNVVGLRQVLVQEVTNPYDIAAEVAHRGVPVVLKMPLPWAAQDWTPATLLSRMNQPEIRNVKFSRTPIFQYCHPAPLDLYPHVVTRYRKNCFHTHNVSSSVFLELLSQPSPSPVADPLPSSREFVTYSSVLDQFGPQVAEDLDLLEIVSLPDVPHQTTIWLSPNGTVTPLHFDISHNFFVQIFGQKHFLLLPPNETSSLLLYPSLHPGRQSVRHPELARDVPTASEVTVGPGDILYIPPHWLHQVTSLQLSISVAVWSHDAATSLYEDLMDHFTLPIPLSWDGPMRTLGLEYVLQALTRQLRIGNISEFVHVHLLSRYIDICVGDELPERLSCASTIALPVQGVEAFTRGLKLIADRFEQILRVGGSTRRDIFLADFFEVTALSVIGTHRLRPFFRSLSECVFAGDNNAA